MFVKIINHNEREAVEKAFPKTRVYECTHYQVYKASKQDRFAISIECVDGKAHVMELPKEKHSVFVMNNEGQTIDTFSWLN